MIITVTSAGAAALLDQESFGALKVVLDPADSLERALGLLRAAAAEEPDHVWIPVHVLQGLAQRTPAWDESFATMIVKVTQHGWYDRATQRVKAHVERAALEHAA